MQKIITRVVVVGGGTAGWLTAGIIAAKNPLVGENSHTEVILVESPDVKNLGVGEGTWPTMRDTLRLLGIAEKHAAIVIPKQFHNGSKMSS